MPAIRRSNSHVLGLMQLPKLEHKGGDAVKKPWLPPEDLVKFIAVPHKFKPVCACTIWKQVLSCAFCLDVGMGSMFRTTLNEDERLKILNQVVLALALAGYNL